MPENPSDRQRHGRVDTKRHSQYKNRMFEIAFTEGAIEDLRTFKRAERRKILAELESQLAFEPTVETRNRKKLRPNKLAEWELRIDRFRVFYDVGQDDLLIKVEAVGYKRGNRLFIGGKEYEL